MLPTQLFAFGFGYVATELARILKADGIVAAGTSRSPASAENLREQGWDAALWPGSDIVPPEGSAWLISVPPDDAGCPVFRAFEPLATSAAWIGYLSTTGVYGDRGGAEVDEASTLRPTGARGARRVQAEAAWRALRPSAHIFRLPGIYGPGRNALQQLRDGRAYRVLKPGHRFSRIHVADIVQTLRASMARPRAGAVYNVCDDLPAESAEVLAYAAELFGVAPAPAVPFEKAGLSAMARSFYRDNKTVANGLIKRELGVELRYPTYREGLADLLGDYSAG